MSSIVSVNQKHVTKEYLHLIKLRMCEDLFPINTRMIDYTIERNKICEDLPRLICRLFKPVDVRKRELLVKTEEKLRIY